MSVPASLRWILLALVGLVVAGAIALVASNLVSKRIGLASQPISAGRELVSPPAPSSPRGESANRRDARERGNDSSTTAPTAATTIPAPAPTTVAPAYTTTVSPAPAPPSPTAPAGGFSGSESEAGGGDD